MRYEFEAEVWRYRGEAAWFFATLPAEVGHGVKQLRGPARGWGSVRVTVTTGQATWRTSVFPDKRSGSFLLPVKADVRRAEGIEPGQTRHFVIELDH